MGYDHEIVTRSGPVSSDPPKGVVGLHPLSALLPALDERSFRALRDDIAARGQLSPIWLHQGLIVDGRHRYRACLELGVQPWCEEWDQRGDLLEFILGLNLRRRHLTATQRAVVAYRLLPVLEEKARERQKRKPEGSVPEMLPEAWGDSRDQAAAMVGVSGRYVSDVKRIALEAPDKMSAMGAGELTLQGAKRQLGRDREHDRAADGGDWSQAARWAADTVRRLERVANGDPRLLESLERVQSYIGDLIGELSAHGRLAAGAHNEEQMELFGRHHDHA
ncbi:ParB/RepB/Spo0J family partition protein [Geomonas sp. Red32]|uniref:ParB/RepB/Spo0J family partition protein n=1 Tax=Geomonas sp. Red32 TaxID=2912856 RepID=UPI00202CF131|nr:ParB/RepB/Spo0J family partition protein [Geomonas sp. Red32]MCM0083942.1 ParB/RepB/Spo0J family partition protein [Geomonas sp. Red32]